MQANDWPRRDSSDWREQAACRGMGPAMFFPTSADVGAIAQAKAVCAGCPVKAACLEEALEMPWSMDEWGIRAGMGSRARRRIRIARRRQAS